MFLKRIELQMVSDRKVPYGSIPDGVPKGFVIKNSADVFSLFSFLSERVQEEMYALYLDTSNRVIGFYMVARGSMSQATFDVMDIVRPALLSGATGVILIHNHPSGNVEPSTEDLLVTKRVRSGCDLLGLRFLDHIIIGDGTFKSIINM